MSVSNGLCMVLHGLTDMGYRHGAVPDLDSMVPATEERGNGLSGTYSDAPLSVHLNGDN